MVPRSVQKDSGVPWPPHHLTSPLQAGTAWPSVKGGSDHGNVTASQVFTVT